MVHRPDELGTAEPCLRPYQIDIIAQFHEAIAAGKRHILLVAPTGAGKTVIAAAIIRGFAEQ
jgi:superfamily II DNA or RNA helicase